MSEARFKPPRPRIIDDEWIDPQLLKEWLRECLEHHQDTCDLEKSYSIPTLSNLILVDVVQACLVRPASPCRYVALSYVWGRAGNFLTTTKTFHKLCEPGVLQQLREFELTALPQTIAQAIQLTLAIGEQYLWVDSLCIIQDGSDKTHQLNAMASIFANATLTIVAAQGVDANAGFRGLRDISRPRVARQYIAPLMADQHLVRPTSRHVWIESFLEPWSSRAWTFQESIFSRRVLYFAHESVRWSCKKARWSEESESSDCMRAYAFLEQRQLALSSPQLSKFTLPVLDEYQALVNAFNLRKLTYPEDVPSAFAGISASLSAKFSGGLISGLPEFFFDVCLLWRPLRRLGTARRRRSTSNSAQYNLPSWSWTGWETEVIWPYTWNHHEDPAGPIPIMFGDLRPFYQTVFHATYENDETYQIKNQWLNSARSASNEQLLTAGWTSHKVSESELREYGSDGPVYFFKHGTERQAEFWFPVPHKPEPVAPRASGRLRFETTLGQFRLGETRRSMTRIHALDGSHAGTLWQHAEDDEDFVQATNGQLEIRTPVEFVAILGCKVPRDESIVWDQSTSSSVKSQHVEATDSKVEEIYNVMWIKTIGNASYRKATGVIQRSVWDNSELCQVSLCLR